MTVVVNIALEKLQVKKISCVWLISDRNGPQTAVSFAWILYYQCYHVIFCHTQSWSNGENTLPALNSDSKIHGENVSYVDKSISRSWARAPSSSEIWILPHMDILDKSMHLRLRGTAWGRPFYDPAWLCPTAQARSIDTCLEEFGVAEPESLDPINIVSPSFYCYGLMAWIPVLGCTQFIAQLIQLGLVWNKWHF